MLPDQIVNAHEVLLHELGTGIIDRMDGTVEILRVHAFPPSAFAVGLGQSAVVGDAGLGTLHIAAVFHRHKLTPYPPRRTTNSRSGR